MKTIFITYELAPFGISVKTIASGYIRTAFASNVAYASAPPYEVNLCHQYQWGFLQ